MNFRHIFYDSRTTDVHPQLHYASFKEEQAHVDGSNLNHFMQNAVDVCTLYFMLSIFNVNLGNRLPEPEVTALSLMIYNQNV